MQTSDRAEAKGWTRQAQRLPADEAGGGESGCLRPAAAVLHECLRATFCLIIVLEPCSKAQAAMAGAAQRQEDLFPAASGPELIRAHQKVSKGAADSIPRAIPLPPTLP